MSPLSRTAAALFLFLMPTVGNAETVVRWGNNGEVTTMDPHGAFSTANAALLGNIYEALVRIDRNLKFEPGLATSWDIIAPDHYRFTIRTGVRFHDGSLMTPRDVVASLRRASLPNSPYSSVTHMIKEVVPFGDNKVDVLLRGPYPVLINDIAGISILSDDWMTAHNAQEPADPTHGKAAYTSMNTNGTGPFRLVSRQPDSQTVLERFPEWWDKPEHTIDRVVFQPIGNDATRLAALLSGQLDLVTPMPLQDVDRVRADPRLKLVEAQDLRVMFLGFNVAKDHLPAGSGANPLLDRRVREALAMATDVEGLTRSVMRGLTKPIATLVAPEIQGYDPAQAEPRTGYDPARAKQLLAEAGFPDGFPIGLDCPSDRFVNGERVCQAIASMWSRAGVKTTLNTMRYAAFMQRSLGGNSDTFLLGWANTPQLDAFSFLNNVLHTKDARAGSWNAGGTSNPELDAMVERTAIEMAPAERQRLLTAAFQFERRAIYTIPLYREPMIFAMRKELDIPASPDGRVRLWMAKMP